MCVGIISEGGSDDDVTRIGLKALSCRSCIFFFSFRQCRFNSLKRRRLILYFSVIIRCGKIKCTAAYCNLIHCRA